MLVTVSDGNREKEKSLPNLKKEVHRKGQRSPAEHLRWGGAQTRKDCRVASIKPMIKGIEGSNRGVRISSGWRLGELFVIYQSRATDGRGEKRLENLGEG